jgi:hypothetical protein
MKRGLLLIVGMAFGLVGCSDPCQTLSDRLCADLGADCEVWRGGVDQTLLPQAADRYRRNALMGKLLKQRPEDNLCRAMGEAGNYQGYTLPQASFLIKSKKDPASAGPAPKLPQLVIDSGYPAWLMYAIAPLCILGMFIYLRFANRRLQSGNADGA